MPHSAALHPTPMDNAAELKEKARTLESSGQDQAALDLYARLAEEAAEPDAAVLVRAGNLQLRLGRPAAAAASFSRCAEMLREAGLRNGAIALWRRVLRIDPDARVPLLRLAALNAREGFDAEARAALAEYVQRMEGAGEADAALDALRSHVRSFPGDAAVRRLLVERLEARGLAEEARDLARAESPEPPPAAASEPESPHDLEVVGSGWEGADLADPPELAGDGIELVPTRIEEGDLPTEAEVAPLAGLEPTLLEGLEPTSLEPSLPEPDPEPSGEGEPLALLGSEPDAGGDDAGPADDLDLPEDPGGDLPLLGAEPLPELAPAAEPPAGEHEVLMRRVEAAVRAGDPGGIAAALLDLGRHFAGARQSDRAAEVFERILEIDPAHEEARRELAAIRPG